MWFSASRAASLSGLSMAMVNYLCRTNIVEPSCNCTRGHGAHRHYSFGELVALRLVAKLSAVGVSPLRLKKSLVGLRKLHPKITLTNLPASHIITDGQTIYLRSDSKSWERTLDGQFAFAFVVELAYLQKEVGERLKEPPKLRLARR
jgi:hypothetical protein